MQGVDTFIADATATLNRWKNTRDLVAEKTKVLNENRTSIENLERNIGGDNEHLKQLRKGIDAYRASNAKVIAEFDELASDLKGVRQECDMILRKILDLHCILDRETGSECQEGQANGDAVGVKAAQVFYDSKSNLQLRSDPPIIKEDKTEPTAFDEQFVGSMPITFSFQP